MQAPGCVDIAEGRSFEGLTQAEAERRLAVHGPNVLRQSRERGVGQIVLEAVREPAFALLLAAAVLYLVLGDLAEGALMVLGALASLGLVVAQENRSERALAALRVLSEPFARVLRDGREQRLAASLLVPGDIILVGEGERLPADGVLVSGDVLSVDESVLTGESAPVAKRPTAGAAFADLDEEPGGEDTPLVFGGALNTAGQGVVQVLRTGQDTRIGRIGASLATIAQDHSPLQKTTARLVGLMGVFALAVCALVVLAYGLMRGQWVQGALSGLTVSISLIPEEYPMVLAVFLALGAWRLARRNVLVRRSAAAEAIGSVTMLCVDKTGTLTENRMDVAALWREGAMWRPGAAGPDEGFAHLLSVARLGSSPRPVDPMDRAIRALAQTHSEPEEASSPLRTYPLRADFLAFIQAWPGPDGGVVFAAKGAPEAIFRLCGLEDEARAALEAEVVSLADEGLRVLGVASCRRGEDDGSAPHGLTFQFEGLVGFLDPVRSDVAAAIAKARRAGVAVVMITGDYPATAAAIARTAGVDLAGGVISGRDLAVMSPEALAAALRRTRVFARMTPDQKLALVRAAKANGDVVAMTGDGVNDAPALEASDVGVAMGMRGTDVAREAADIVLLDDRFTSILDGIYLGRRIFANLRKALIFITAVHIPIAGLALLPILLGLPPILFPAHVVLLELVIDPVCSIVFEREPAAQGEEERPPRPAGRGLFGRRELALGVVQGIAVLLAAGAVYLWMLNGRAPAPEARALTFVTLVCGNLALALANAASPTTRLFHPGHAIFWSIAGLTLAALAAVIWTPAGDALFQFQATPPLAGGFAAAVGLAAGGWLGLLRRWRWLRTGTR